jgi:hypothetical protein
MKLDRGEPSEGMTAARVARLSCLGFSWDPRCPRCQAQEEGRRYIGPHWADRDCDAAPEDRAAPEERAAQLTASG